ncbi:MAG TPA: tetratricopeptide repeat protein [Deltaproteobacteria bacterium]|nr:tetratricopeptide repeat protein [Candidatus Binatota bacterium]HIL12850.1 tetratricopeptide repeat protein [Deltaproteobacteria bacterium]
MKNARLLLMPCFLTATLLVSACGPQYGVVSGDRGTRELQRVQVRQRRAIEELRIEQERLRAMLEELGYQAESSADRVAPVVSPVPGVEGPGRVELLPGQAVPGQEGAVVVEGPAAVAGVGATATAGAATSAGNGREGLLEWPGLSAPDGWVEVGADKQKAGEVPFGRIPSPSDAEAAEADTAQATAPPADRTAGEARAPAAGAWGDDEADSGGPGFGMSESSWEKPKVPSSLRGSDYGKGVELFEAGDNDGAIQAFRNFIHDHSDSSYRDDAQFMIGEACLRQGQYSRAILEYNRVVVSYRSGDRTAAALLRLADAFAAIGDEIDAKLSLQKVVNGYPGSGEANEAWRRLRGQGS